MDEKLPEQAIETAEERPSAHHHADVTNGTEMADHLTQAHGLDTPDHLSESTLDGLHDRVHHEADAADD